MVRRHPFPDIWLFRDERIAVFDKPHFLSTIPRGRHVVQSAVVKARQALDLPELSAAHRLDRAAELTASPDVDDHLDAAWRLYLASLGDKGVIAHDGR